MFYFLMDFVLCQETPKIYASGQIHNIAKIASVSYQLYSYDSH